MKVTTVVLAAVAILSGVDALTESDSDNSKLTHKWDLRGEKDYGQSKDRKGRKMRCPASVRQRGVCNGNSCHVKGANYPCVFGSCTGKGGGDGACCGMLEHGVHARCPNGRKVSRVGGKRVEEDRGGWGWFGAPEAPVTDWFTKRQCHAIGPDMNKMAQMLGGGSAMVAYIQTFMHEDYLNDTAVPQQQEELQQEDVPEEEEEEEEPAQDQENDVGYVQAPPKKTPPKKAPPKKAPPKEAPPKKAPVEKSDPSKETPKETPKQTPPKDAPPKDAPSKDAPPKDAPPKDAPPKDAPPSNVPPKKAPPKQKKPKLSKEDKLRAKCGPHLQTRG